MNSEMWQERGEKLASRFYKPADLKNLPVLHQGQCCDCKIDTGSVRVWLCRVAGGVTIENYLNGRWVTVAGDCNDTGTDVND